MECMRRTFISVALLIAGSLAISAYSQVGQDLKNAGQDAKSTAKADTNKSTHAIRKGATKSTHAVKKGLHKSATKVSDKTRDTASHQ